MDSGLLHIVRKRLEDETTLSGEARRLVVASCSGEHELEEALSGAPSLSGDAALSPRAEPVGAYLAGLSVEGFRGIGPTATLPIEPGPGITLIVGRNGSGKSSFAEALELLLTGDNQRWAERASVWREGWRNLHHPSPCLIEAQLLVEGQRGMTTVTRRWREDADLEDDEVEVRFGRTVGELGILGWGDAMASYRPFLSYNELGSLLDEGPSRLYDALSLVLGLDELVQAGKRLARARRTREELDTQVKSSAGSLIASLQQIDDERAHRCLAALESTPSDLNALEGIAVGTAQRLEEGGRLDVLRVLCGLDVPDETASASAAASLRGAAAGLALVRGTGAESARQVAGLLQAALEFHVGHGDSDCPVCGRGGALNPEWRAQAQERIEELRIRSEQATAARRRATEARRSAMEILSDPPLMLDRAQEVGLGGDGAIAAWRAWAAGRDIDDLGRLAQHLEDTAPALRATTEQLRESAKLSLDQQEDTWRPIAGDLAAWVGRAKDAWRGMAAVAALKDAERWLKQAESDIRNERFAPIGEEAMRVWELLRVQSNVELGRVELEGTGTSTRRRVTLDVTVDGMAGAALGVMSQGELNSLALSLFLPRATLDESPFRFVVIDDPVQSMDPARVDGLARVLEEVAKSRQVLVFTHDARLYEAIRRLQIDATVWEVTRRPASLVEFRHALDPVNRYVKDAFALASTPQLPRDTACRIVPGFCRLALEAACIQVVRRRRLARGEQHADVEELLASPSSLLEHLTLALFDDSRRVGEVRDRIERDYKKGTAELVRRCNKGAHEGDEGDLVQLVREAEAFAGKLLHLR